jgi:DNA-binding NarL/FixJ family response regulator
VRPFDTVLIVEDSSDTRALIAAILEDAGFPTYAVESSELGLAAVRSQQLRLVITDVHLPGMSGYEFCHRLRERYEDAIGILIVSGERTASYDRVAGMLLGADDYVVKPFSTDELVARVRRVASRLVPKAHKPVSVLTCRELEVLRLLTDGLDGRDIARHLVISPKTVGTHIEHIFSKLGVRSQAQAVALALRNDLVSALSTADDVPGALPLGDKEAARGATADRGLRLVRSEAAYASAR